jgi:N-acetylmuramic acid 6-phosphate (MurNAc-6-P) etherase
LSTVIHDILQEALPTTEQSNTLTVNIDVASPSEISQLINLCEQQIFGEGIESQGILDPHCVSTCEVLASEIRSYRQEPLNVVLVGSGTSGRLCRLIAKLFSRICPKELVIIPIIAGGISALVKAQPNTEDSFTEGYESFGRHVSQSAIKRTFTIGVTCGLSSSFVRGCLFASQVANPNGCCLLGFNEERDATICLEIEPYPAPSLINPIVGPEPISGSVRMKCGTSTLIMLTAILNSALLNYSVERQFARYARLLALPEACLLFLGKIIAEAGDALKAGHGIIYYGAGIPGILGLYDAAECSPTFGARDNQVRAFLRDGFEAMRYYPFESPQAVSWAQRVARPDFRNGDFCVLLSEVSGDDSLTIKKQTLGNVMRLSDPSQPIRRHFQKYQFLRTELNSQPDALHLNANLEAVLLRTCLTHISTGAFTQSGKIYRNTMIDLRITNQKLWLRASRLVSRFTGRNIELCQNVLVRTIFPRHPQIVCTGQVSITDLIDAAASSENVVPRAILSLTFPDASDSDILEMIRNEPRIRKVIQALCQK